MPFDQTIFSVTVLVTKTWEFEQCNSESCIYVSNDFVFKQRRVGIIEIQTLNRCINTCTPFSKFFSLHHKHTIILELISNKKIEYPF